MFKHIFQRRIRIQMEPTVVRLQSECKKRPIHATATVLHAGFLLQAVQLKPKFFVSRRIKTTSFQTSSVLVPNRGP